MSVDNLVKYLIDNFEKERKILYVKMEEEEKKIDSFYLSEKKRLEKEYKKKEEDIKKELKKRLNMEYLEKELTHLSMFENTLMEKINRVEQKAILALRNEDYESVFQKLLSELPDIEWGKIIVNPLDIKLAEKFFSNLKILSDESITGGYTAISRDECIRINNTLEKRVEKANETIIIEILKEVKDYLEKNYAD